jgi:hypothetical protein
MTSQGDQIPMSNQTGSPRMPGYTKSTNRRHFRYTNPDLRASDAERAEVADRLSKHYADGRLDQAEFNERMERAMNAKTHSDFAGLFADLPDLPEDQVQGGPAGPARATLTERRRPGAPMHRLLYLAMIVVIAVIAGQALAHLYIPWVLIGILVIAWLWFGPRHHHYR